MASSDFIDNAISSAVDESAVTELASALGDGLSTSQVSGSNQGDPGRVCWCSLSPMPATWASQHLSLKPCASLQISLCSLPFTCLAVCDPFKGSWLVFWENLDKISPVLKMEVRLTCLKRWVTVGVAPHPSDRFLLWSWYQAAKLGPGQLAVVVILTGSV